MASEELEQQQRRVGSTLAGKYMLVRLLGAGGMGAVYEAENAGTGRRVAVKVMHPAASANPELTARFLREARASTRIGHPNIVEVLDLDRDADGTLYIVQEFLQGHDLGSAIVARKGEPFSPQETLEILLPVMRALVSAHAQKVVHRDLKPDNVFLTPGLDGRVVPKLIDFGIAKLMGDEASQPSAEGGLGLTRTGMAMGTPYYMSPEQARGARSIDAQTDVWAIGVVLFEMLTGRRPFEADNYNALMISIITEDAPRVDTLRPELSPRLADVVAKALARERAARFATMDAFVDALLAITEPTIGSGTVVFAAPAMPDRSGAARVTSEVALGTTLGQSAREISGVSPAVPVPSRGRALWIVAGLVAVGGLGAWVSLRPHRGSPPVSAVTTVHTVAPAPPVTPVVPPAPAAPTATFRVLLRAQPPTAVLSLDGVDTGANTLVRELPRDGRSHRVTASAQGYISRSMDFQDTSPPDVITLDPVPVAPTVVSHVDVPAERPRHAATAAAHASTASPSAPTEPPAHPTSAIHPHGVQVQRDYP